MRPSARVRANRENAKRSTGPRTKDGKDRVSRNALRHGLAVAVEQDNTLSASVVAVAKQIAGPNAHPDLYAAACRVAEAQIDLQRINSLRIRLLSDPEARIKRPSVCELIQHVKALDRIVENKHSPGEIAALIASEQERRRPRTLEEGLGNLAPELFRLERYERRAFSRLKTAMRRLELHFPESVER